VVEPFQSQDQSDASPLVTVAMPVYNAGKYLRMAVLSIVKQTFQNWELLIIDDGSTDNALQDIADIDDARIRILRDGENKGLAARLNEAIDLARGQYLARMDQDDVSYPERFAQQIEALKDDPQLDLVAVRAITIDENNQATGLFPCAISHEEICSKPWRGFYLPHPTWMSKIEWFRKHRYTVPGPYFCEDQELLLRSYLKSRFATVDEVLFGYRVRGKINWRKLAKTRRTILRIRLRHFMEVHQWHFVLLAMLIFVGQVASDFLKSLRRKFYQDKPKILAAPISSQWHIVLSRLAHGPK
jgi:glycosyltransferase involved in cell wall biosynthesis